LIESVETTSPSSWHEGEKGQGETKSWRTKDVDSRTVDVGGTAWAELRGKSGKVDKGDKFKDSEMAMGDKVEEIDKGDKVGELLDEDMLS
jgi:hypothetical protein